MAFVACTDSGSDDGGGNSNNEKPKVPEITLDATAVNFTTDGGSTVVTFSSSDAWTAEAINNRADAWCSVSPTSGSAGNSQVTITTTANDTTDDRTATVVIKSGTIQKTIAVSQKQKDALTVTSSKFEVSADGGEIEIEVKANIDFNVEIDESAKSWVTHRSTRAMKTSTLLFEVDENSDSEKRKANITITSGKLRETVTIYQESNKPSIVLTQNEYTVPSAGETIAVEVKSNVDVTVEMPKDAGWITENTTRATSTNTYYFDIETNEEYDQRTAEIKFTNKENNLSEVVRVVQTQKDALVIAKDSYNVDSDGDKIQIEVGHNIDFDVEISADWITKEQTRAFTTETLTFNIAKNPTNDNREGKITFKSKDGSLSQTVKVYQAQKDALIVSKKDIVVNNESGSVSFEIQTNVEFKVSEPNVSWLRSVTTRGLTIHTLRYEYDENTSYDSREAQIVVTDTKNNKSETITITQTQKDAIVIAENSYAVKGEGGEINIEVGHNIEFDIKIDGSWITRKQTRALETDKLTFVVAENDTDKVRTGYITFTSEDGAISQKITITQGTTAYEIRYTTSNGKILPIKFQWYHFLANVISHEYVDGEGVITFDGAIEYISTDTFANCATLTSITIPKSVTDADGSIYGCTNLENIYGPLASEDNKCLIINGELSAFAPKGLTEYTIPDDVTSIGVGIFYGCSTLKKIIIPESVTTIKDSAFWGCISLDNLDIPDGITSLPYSFCRGCKNLSSIEIPDGITTIGSYAFFECSTLNNIVLPESVTTIEERAFYECIGLTSISIPENVTSIDDLAFYSCTNLKSVTIHEGVISIGSYAFGYCSKLTDIAIPSSVLTIGTNAFYSCDSITKIVIPNGVTKIEESTFSRCESLKEVTIPNSVISIGENAFFLCDSLESITIPESVVAIEEQAFYDCGSLKEVYCKPSTPPALGNEAFFRYVYSDSPERKFYVPAASINAYKSKWSDYADEIVGYEFK